jgi:hypothetical protein
MFVSLLCEASDHSPKTKTQNLFCFRSLKENPFLLLLTVVLLTSFKLNFMVYMFSVQKTL